MDSMTTIIAHCLRFARPDEPTARIARLVAPSRAPPALEMAAGKAGWNGEHSDAD